MLKYEQGVGLLEVLVSVLILAIAVLGFVAMQMRAIQATDETLLRSDAMVIIRNISEDLRHYPTTTQKDAYVTAINTASAQSPKACTDKVCNKTEQVAYNASQAIKLAQESGIKVRAQRCTTGGEISKICLIASWNDTEPTMDNNATSCTDNSGAYKAGASCIVMETY